MIEERQIIRCRAITRGVRPGVQVTCVACEMTTVVSSKAVPDLIRRHLKGVHDMEVDDG